jgi:hypothetical protein
MRARPRPDGGPSRWRRYGRRAPSVDTGREGGIELQAGPDRGCGRRGQLELARRLRPHHVVPRGGHVPPPGAGPLAGHLRRDGGGRRRPLLRVAARPRARPRLDRPPGGDAARRHHFVALRRRRSVQGSVPMRRRRAPDRARRPGRVARDRRGVLPARLGNPAAGRGRRRPGVAGLRQPDPARVQHAAGAAP